MLEPSLNTLRQLRDRASSLLRNVAKDLAPFKKEDGTFRRKPDSRLAEWDTNVTTTCSCLMALAATNQFRQFYNEEGAAALSPEQRATNILETLLAAPWMSSGLTDNNAFTTTLVLRAFGFLEQEQIFGKDSPTASSMEKGRVREWDLHLGIRDAVSLAKKLKRHADPASEFLWLSLTQDSRDLISETSTFNAKKKKRLKSALVLDLGRILQSGWIYEPEIFKKASAATQEDLARFKSKPTSYKLTTINRRLLSQQFPGELSKPENRSLKKIAEMMADDPNNFSINQYQPSPAVVYWFVDGVKRAGINLSPLRWDLLCRWAAREFNHRRSLVVAEHDAMMDPVAMGMCACLCALLRTISEKPRLGVKKEHLAILPSRIELERSIEELFSQQTNSGIWHKYFPLFHYQRRWIQLLLHLRTLRSCPMRVWKELENTLGQSKVYRGSGESGFVVRIESINIR